MEAAEEAAAEKEAAEKVETELREQLAEAQAKLKEQEREAKEREREIEDEWEAKAQERVNAAREELLKLEHVEHQTFLQQQHAAETKQLKVALGKHNRSCVP